MTTSCTTSTNKNSDEALVAATKGGDEQAFEELVLRHRQRVLAVAQRITRSPEDAEDVAQEAFLKAFRNLANFRGESKFSTWLISITLNEARSRLRSKKNVKMESLDEPPDGQGTVTPALLRDWREMPSEALERKEVRQLLQQAITYLPLIYREVFLLRDVEDLSVNQSAEALGISVASVKVRLHRARIMLQRKLVPQLKKANPKRRWFSWS